MAVRTDEQRVRDIIDNTTDIDVTPFIRTANLMTNKVSAGDSQGELNTNDLVEIETYLAAHFYGIRDQLLSSKSTGGASGSFQGQTGFALDYTAYGQTAMMLDVTGFLSGLNMQVKNGRPKLQMIWLGSTETQKDNYSDQYD
jgi:hypothetical protein